jgi:hypothetical protein
VKPGCACLASIGSWQRVVQASRLGLEEVVVVDGDMDLYIRCRGVQG